MQQIIELKLLKSKVNCLGKKIKKYRTLTVCKSKMRKEVKHMLSYFLALPDYDLKRERIALNFNLTPPPPFV